MGDMGDMYRDWDKLRKKQKDDNLIHAMNWLKDNQIDFESKNDGNHLIITINKKRIDFWPTTNKLKIGKSIVGNGLIFIKKIFLESNK